MKAKPQRPIAEELFLPCTREIGVGNGVFYRPIRSWGTGTYAGEGLSQVHGDGSGCVTEIQREGYVERVTSPPKCAIHRVYWHRSDPVGTRTSAFLSYPKGMGLPETYFWEAYIPSKGDSISRFIGPNAETACETAIVRYLLRVTKKARARKAA